MAQETPKVKTPDERAFETVANSMEAGHLAQRFVDMLRIAEVTPDEKFDSLALFFVNALSRDKSALWELIGPVGQGAMRAAIDNIADEQDAKLDKQKEDWKKIRDRNAPPEGGE